VAWKRFYTSSAKDDTRWQPRAADPELEAEMLRRLMVRLGSEESVPKPRWLPSRLSHAPSWPSRTTVLERWKSSSASTVRGAV
jgi:uncharacterized lipoprotein